MIKALIDTNVILDALASREPFNADAEKLFMLAAEEKFQGFITANSVTDIYYIVRKNLSDAMAREAIRNLLQLFSIVGISGAECETALDSAITDYEDALLAECAAKAGVNYIVTRNADFLKAQSEVALITPAAFITKGYTNV